MVYTYLSFLCAFVLIYPELLSISTCDENKQQQECGQKETLLIRAQYERTQSIFSFSQTSLCSSLEMLTLFFRCCWCCCCCYSNYWILSEIIFCFVQFYCIRLLRILLKGRKKRTKRKVVTQNIHAHGSAVHKKKQIESMLRCCCCFCYLSND